MTAEIVDMPETEHKPLNEIAPIERLGVLLKRYRTNAGLSTEEAAGAARIPEVVYKSVEESRAPLNADQLREVAALFKVRFEPLLDAARHFHQGLWDAENPDKRGVTLTEMSSMVTSLDDPIVVLEQTAIDVVHQAASSSALMRKAADLLVESKNRTNIQIAELIVTNSHDLLTQAKRLQDVLVARGALLPPEALNMSEEEVGRPSEPQGGEEEQQG